MSSKIVNNTLYLQPTVASYSYQVPTTTYNVVTYPAAVPTTYYRSIPVQRVTKTVTTTIPSKTIVKTSSDGSKSSTKYIPTRTIVEKKPTNRFVPTSLPVTYQTYAPTVTQYIQPKTKSIVVKSYPLARTKSYVAYPATKSIVALPVARTKSIVAVPVNRTTTIVQQHQPTITIKEVSQPEPQGVSPGYIQLSAQPDQQQQKQPCPEEQAKQQAQQQQQQQQQQQEQQSNEQQEQQQANPQQNQANNSYPPIFNQNAEANGAQNEWFSDYLYKPNTSHNGTVVANLYVAK